MTITPETIAELKRLEAAAAKGPWRTHPVDDTTIIDPRGRFIASACGGDDDLDEADYNNPDEWPVMEANILLITTMHTSLPALIAAAEENARLRGLLWYAWHEFNAISARSGAPLTHDGMTTCAEDWWSKLRDAFADAIGPDAKKPWPTAEARAALAGGA